MFSIGIMAARSGVKITTIRYYEEINLLTKPGRNSGNQRRYSQAELEQLSFIKHARDLGLGITAIRSLLYLHSHPDQSCADAHAIALAHLDDVRQKLKKLRKLERELKRITMSAHDDTGCNVIKALADHRLCSSEH